MDAITRPLSALLEDVQWFMRATELRVLHVTTSPDLRKAALGVSAAMEAHADNRSPMFVFAQPHAQTDGGWVLRTRALHEQYATSRAALAKAGRPQPDAGELPPAERGLASFVVGLWSIDRSWVMPCAGTIVVLAPEAVEDRAAWAAEIGALVRRGEFGGVRWIVIDDGAAATALEGLSASVLRHRCMTDDDDLVADLAARVTSMAAAPATAGGAALSGAAWPPGIEPPQRKRAPKPAAPPPGRELGIHLLAAGVAMRSGRGAEAVREQLAARDVAEKAELHPERGLVQLGLAGILLVAGQRDRALAAYADAAQWAETHALPGLGAQAHLALGVLHASAGQQAAAAKHYATSAELAERAKLTVLAIEGWRLAGQLAIAAGQEQEGIAAWGEAIRLAKGDREAAPLSSAPRMARELAERCRDRGLRDQADSLDALAAELEAVPKEASAS